MVKMYFIPLTYVGIEEMAETLDVKVRIILGIVIIVIIVSISVFTEKKDYDEGLEEQENKQKK